MHSCHCTGTYPSLGCTLRAYNTTIGYQPRVTNINAHDLNHLSLPEQLVKIPVSGVMVLLFKARATCKSTRRMSVDVDIPKIMKKPYSPTRHACLNSAFKMEVSTLGKFCVCSQAKKKNSDCPLAQGYGDGCHILHSIMYTKSCEQGP